MAKKTKEEPVENPEKERAPLSDNLVREDLPPCKYYLSTGSTLLDLAISDRLPGGIGSGRLTHVFGDASTAKTVLVQEVLGAAQRLGGTAIFIDAEHTLDFDRAGKLFGLMTGAWNDILVQEEYMYKPLVDKNGKPTEVLDIDKSFIYRGTDSIEALWDDEIGGIIKLMEGGFLAPPVVIGIDSLSALPSRAEQAGRLEEGTYGTSRAKQFSAGFRKMILPMAKHSLTILAVDQTREKIGVTFGNRTAVSGGKAIEFYASTRVSLNHLGQLKNKWTITDGIVVGFKVVKNKLAPPFRSGKFNVVFDYGIDDVASNLLWLKANESVEGSRFSTNGTWILWDNENIGHGMSNTVKVFEDSGREKEVEGEVERVWRVLYSPSDRKRRHEISDTGGM